MILKDNMFSITASSPVEGGWDFTVRMNPECFIYKAHFPGEPITPGVCIMQIAVELLEIAAGAALSPKLVKNIKFLRVIVPDETPVLEWSIRKMVTEDGSVSAQVTASAGGEAYAKLSLVCSID